MSRLAPGEPALCLHPLGVAVVEVVAERGYPEATVEEIVARAGVGREEFDRLFADKADAVLRVFEGYIADFKARVGRAYASSSPRWPDNLRAAAYEIVALIEEHPQAYRFAMWRILEVGEMARLRREELFSWCAGLIDAGREFSPEPGSVPSAAALIATGSVVEALTRDAAGKLDRPLVEIVPDLMYGAVRPFLGEEAAQAERGRIARRER